MLNKKNAPFEWKKIGEVGVDTATLLITDPSYMYSSGIYPPSYEGWLNDVLFPLINTDSSQIYYPLGHPGAGVAVHLPGDGVMEVFAKFEHGIVTEIRIK